MSTGANGVIGVGLIGASPNRGWAKGAHLPTLRRLDEFTLVAVATSRGETAARAAGVYGANRAFANAAALIEDPDVELVVVAVKVPLHHDLVTAALTAGKHVLCEWPLGNGTAEAESLATAAAAAPGRAVVVLQARLSPHLTFMRDLIADGYVGEVLSASVVASGYGWGAAIDEPQAYLFDARSGATMLTVTGGHLLDAVRWCLGDLGRITATRAQRRPDVAILEPRDVERLYRFDAATAGLAGPARNVAHLYRALARDLANGGHRCPDFGTALEVHRLLDRVEDAAASTG